MNGESNCEYRTCGEMVNGTYDLKIVRPVRRMRVWAWVDGRTTLRLSLPAQLSSSTQAEIPSKLLSARGLSCNPGPVLAHDFVTSAALEGVKERISESDWTRIATELQIDSVLSNALFTVSSTTTSSAKNEVFVDCLAIAIFLLGLEHFSHTSTSTNNDRVDLTKSDLVCDYVRENLGHLLEILCLARNPGLPYPTVFTHSASLPLSSQLSFLDVLFECLADEEKEDVQQDVVNGSRVNQNEEGDAPNQLSVIAECLWAKNGELTSAVLLENLRRCLCVDPYYIDDLPLYPRACPPSPAKRTTIGAGDRRKVLVTGWNRIELLRRSVYRGAHFRLSCSPQKASMVYLPWRSQTAVIDCVSNCPAIVLGPVTGTVLIRNTVNTLITVACRHLLLHNCRDITVNCLSRNPIIMRNCTEIRIGPYNTYYRGIQQEFRDSGISIEYNRTMKEPILLDPDSSYSLISSEEFYLQPVPFEQYGCIKEENAFFSNLPEGFSDSWHRRLHLVQDVDGVDGLILKDLLPERDRRYLESKIVDAETDSSESKI